ncbi:hypothetical protein [Bifidobacterium longum]|uniref:hypothetical protein n=1 Tax=Bifidobacterium longum TaxID=216816 RepID=UPI00103FCDD4|nr:hypothetical protein [Bifidobacterium longum]
MWTASSLNQPKIKIIKNIKKIKIIKSWVEPTEENSRGDNDPAAIRGDNNRRRRARHRISETSVSAGCQSG